MHIWMQNWQKEIEKWLAGRLPTLVVDSGDRETTEKELGTITTCTLLILSFSLMYSREVGV